MNNICVPHQYCQVPVVTMQVKTLMRTLVPPQAPPPADADGRRFLHIVWEVKRKGNETA